MLKTLRNAFKIKDVRNRILFTFMMLIVIRIGSELPIPGVKGSVFQSWLNSKSADGLGFVDAITGGSFSQMSVFALNITPYITSSIIMQLLTIAIPKLEEMQRDGEDGNQFDIEGYRRDLIRKAAGSREGTVLIATLIAEMYLKMTGKDGEGSLEDTLDMILSGINTTENEAEARHFINEKE